MNTNNPTNRFSWNVALMVSFGIGLLAVAGSIFIQTRGESVFAFLGNFSTTLSASSTPLGSGTSYAQTGQPVRLIIPSIGVDANVQSVGLYWKGDGTMGIPTNFTDVAWYNLGPRPGMPGSAVIDGHLDGKDVKEAVFYNLDKLKAGDSVMVVDSKGKTLQFRVLATKLYDYQDSTDDIFSSNVPTPRLNLITCAGDWMPDQKLYDKRVVVFTELVTSG